jgi:hypothetical protein
LIVPVQGSCGDVYKGKLRGMTTVAIKKLTGVNQAAFLREAQIMECVLLSVLPLFLFSAQALLC